jgi:hypothetical protein
MDDIRMNLFIQKLWGWYSHQQEECSGLLIYPNPSGKMVVVSQVTSKPEHNTGYVDIFCVGRVVFTDGIRRISRGANY